MKRLLIAFISCLCLFSSCSKEDDKSLAGTNWEYSNTVLQFTSKTAVTVANIELNTSSSGTYTYSDNKVTFNLVEKGDAITFTYDYAEVNGSMMTVTYHYTFAGKETTQTRIFNKK